jgi:lipopolysaccharide/colanic/teichoic acid biosynthesis glycosyltransferase
MDHIGILQLEGPISRCSWKQAFIKDLVERPLAGVILVLAFPLLAGLAAAVRLTSGGPVLHRRRVLGQGGTVFEALKFRTMVVDAGEILARDATLRAAFEANHKLVEDPRVTRLGRVLRRYSLDELPQLINVVRGEMWLIGPRMISPEELVRYGSWASKLVSVKPGLTGLWQVSGRQQTTYARRIELDMHYIDHWTFATDVKILLRTVAAVVSARGAH